MKIKVATSILGLVSAMLFVGCASSGNQSLKKETESSVNQKIAVGRTSKREVRAHFGSPFQTSFTDGGLEIWTYELAKMKADAVNYIPLVGLFGSSASGTKKQLVILFDEKDMVKKFSMSDSPVAVKTGVFR